MVAFKHLNLLQPWPVKGPFDMIFCRNVMIYFDKPTQKNIVERYADVLDKNGYLCIGHAENISHVAHRFKLIGQTIYSHAPGT
jgi:chemotaxis protein methyltransferase CheR